MYLPILSPSQTLYSVLIDATFSLSSHKCLILLCTLYCSYTVIHVSCLLTGSILDGARIEVTLAKPVDKDAYNKLSPTNRSMRQPTSATTTTPIPYGFVPIDCSLLPSLYPTSPSFVPASGKLVG